MIGIAIITHGNLSEQLVETAKLIMGENPEVHAITFTASESLDTLINKTNLVVEKYKEDGCLILTDIMGGSATNICEDILKMEKIQVITGVNLSMVLEAVGYRHGSDIATLANKVQDSGIRSIINLKKFFEKRAEAKK